MTRDRVWWSGVVGSPRDVLDAPDGRSARVVFVRMPPHGDRRFEAAPGVVGEASGDRAVVLSGDGRSISTLSRVGSLIWQRLPACRSDLVDLLVRTFPTVDPERLERDLDTFIADLETAGLLVGHDADG